MHMSDEWEEEEIMKSKKLWKSFEKQECTWVMSEKRKRRQEALIRLFTLLAWPPSSYFHIFQALFLWKQSHVFLRVASCPSWWICCLYPLWHLFLKIRWPNLNQRVSDKRNLNHIHMFNAKSLMTFFWQTLSPIQANCRLESPTLSNVTARQMQESWWIHHQRDASFIFREVEHQFHRVRKLILQVSDPTSRVTVDFTCGKC